MRSAGRLATTAPRRWTAPLLVACLIGWGCGGDREASGSGEGPGAPTAEPSPAEVFWASLETLCGQAFEGRVTESNPPDASFDGQRLVMHVRECSDGEIRIPFFVGEDRSRTWVITPNAGGLRLKHDHRHEDGSEDAVTQYGGDTDEPGSDVVQEFVADAFTAELVPTAATNVWSIEVHPRTLFVYALRREGSDRRFRAEFDLTRPVPAPPPPWG